MNTILLALLIVVAVGGGLWLVTLVMEALRQKPRPPATLRWSPDIPIQTIDIGGAKLRYIKSGKGPVLVLLHTLRTQLDLFEKIVPELSKHFTVYAFDYPGHGYSAIPEGRYDAAFFLDCYETRQASRLPPRNTAASRFRSCSCGGSRLVKEGRTRARPRADPRRGDGHGRTGRALPAARPPA